MSSPEDRPDVHEDPDAMDPDAGPTMTAPPEDRPDAGASALRADGVADSPDAADADEGAGPDPRG